MVAQGGKSGSSLTYWEASAGMLRSLHSSDSRSSQVDSVSSAE